MKKFSFIKLCICGFIKLQMSLQTIKLFEMCYIFTYIHMSAYFGEYIVLYMKYVNIRISCKHTHIYIKIYVCNIDI